MSWKLIKDDSLLLESSLELLFAHLQKLGDEVEVRIFPKEKRIVLLNVDNKINRSELISNGMNRKFDEKNRKYKGYIDEIGYKFCTQCRISKPIDDFGLRSKSKDGRHRICKECYNRNARRRYRDKR